MVNGSVPDCDATVLARSVPVAANGLDLSEQAATHTAPSTRRMLRFIGGSSAEAIHLTHSEEPRFRAVGVAPV